MTAPEKAPVPTPEVSSVPQRIVWTIADRLARRRLPAGTKLVTRASRFGNPYPAEPVCPHRTQQQAVEDFALLLSTRVDDRSRWCPCMPVRIAGRLRTPAEYPSDVEIRAALAGWHLACACESEPCHASILIALANTQDPPSRQLLAGWAPQRTEGPS